MRHCNCWCWTSWSDFARLLAPDAQQILGRFGLGLPQNILVGPQLFTVRTIDIQNNIEQYYQRHYINIDREKFDKWLVSLLLSEVIVICKAIFKDFEIVNDNIKVQYIQQGKEHTINKNKGSGLNNS